MTRPLLWRAGSPDIPNEGLFASRPVAGLGVWGMTYFATDAGPTGTLYLCIETANNTFAWETLQFVENFGLSGTLAQRPAAGPTIAGASYYAQDIGELFICVTVAAASWAWVLLPGASSFVAAWGVQANWFIDPTNGFDTNDGTQQTQGAGNIGPLKTISEWARRMSAAGSIQTAMVVNILGTTLTTDEPRLTLHVKQSAGGKVRFSGTLGITTIRTGTFTPVTAANPATNVAQQGTDSLGATWTAAISASAVTGKRVRNTTVGARLNSTFWPMKDLTLGAARFSQPILAPVFASGFFGSTTLSSLSNNDTYALEQLPLVKQWGLQFNIDGFNAFGQEPVQFNDLAFDNSTSKPFIVANAAQCVAFFNCDMGGGFVGPQMNFQNCRFAGVSMPGITAYILFGGLAVSGFSSNGSVGTIDGRFAVQGNTLNVVGPSLILAALQVFDAAAAGILLFAPTLMALQFGSREIFGSGNGTFGLRCPGTIVAGVSTNSTGITITGTTAAVGIGPAAGITNKAWAAIPALVSDIAAGVGTTLSGIAVNP